MHSFESFLQELSTNTGVKFNILLEDGTSIYLGDFEVDNSEIVHSPLNLANLKASLFICKRQEGCMSLLKYVIENKYRELFSIREQTLIDVLEGKDISFDTLTKNISFLASGCNLFMIQVDGSKYEALNIIKQLYTEQDILGMIYGDNIILLGAFDEVEEHAKSVRESIASDLYCKCRISFGNIIYNIKELRKAYEEARECLLLSKKFDIRNEILYYDKMLFEKIVYSIDNNVKQELLDRFRDRFNQFDSEMISTIEEFVNCGLNISDAARKLYVHRNTLIYRLDKIYKETGFDIRVFEEATVFIIAFLVWKENKN